jgi:hypothetical protein
MPAHWGAGGSPNREERPMKTKDHSKNFVVTLSDRTEADLFCREMLALERGFRRGITPHQIDQNERLATKIHRALKPLLQFAGIAHGNPAPRTYREVAKLRAELKKRMAENP